MNMNPQHLISSIFPHLTPEQHDEYIRAAYIVHAIAHDSLSPRDAILECMILSLTHPEWWHAVASVFVHGPAAPIDDAERALADAFVAAHPMERPA
jgi:hypothetical protein